MSRLETYIELVTVDGGSSVDVNSRILRKSRIKNSKCFLYQEIMEIRRSKPHFYIHPSRIDHHPNVFHMVGVLETLSVGNDYGKKCSLKFFHEFFECEDLFNLIVRRSMLEESESRHLFQQLASALEHIHKNGIIHRNIKPESIVVDKSNVLKITDFQLGCEFDSSTQEKKLSDSIGSPNYAPPEIICGESYRGPEVDVWSSGCVLYAMLFGRLAFDGETLSELFGKIRKGTFPLIKDIPISPQAEDLIRRLLCVDPEKRIKTSEIMRHCWVRNEFFRYPTISWKDRKFSEDEDLDRLINKLEQSNHMNDVFRKKLMDHESKYKKKRSVSNQLEIDRRRYISRHTERTVLNTERDGLSFGLLSPLSTDILQGVLLSFFVSPEKYGKWSRSLRLREIVWILSNVCHHCAVLGKTNKETGFFARMRSVHSVMKCCVCQGKLCENCSGLCFLNESRLYCTACLQYGVCGHFLFKKSEKKK